MPTSLPSASEPRLPAVSIVVPVFNDEDHIREAIASCLAQTDTSYEVVVVDDCSTDDTPAIVNEFAARHPQLRLITLERNSTAFQARKVGVAASRGSYLIFLDGDDVLSPRAVESIRRHSRSSADIIHFGTSIVGRDGSRHRGFEAKLQPRVPRLRGSAILTELFLSRKTFEGHLWNKAYRTDFAKPIFDAFPDTVRVPRANDLPVSLLLAARADSYVSTRDKLYTYHYGSGQVGDGLLSADQYAKLVDFRPSFDIVEATLRDLMPRTAYESVLKRLREQFVARSVRLMRQLAQPSGDAIELLLSVWPAPDVLSAVYSRYRSLEAELLPLVAEPSNRSRAGGVADPKTVALYIDQRGVGGMQRVVSLQAQLLVRAGYRVVVVAPMDRADFPYALPDVCPFVSLTAPAANRHQALHNLIAGLEATVAEHDVDTVILHSNYRHELLYLVLALERQPVRTLLTMHNFALRAVLDRSTRFGFLRAAALRSDCLTVLSRTDEAFWRLAGVERVRYVSNPVDFSLEDEPAVSESASRTNSPEPQRACDVLWYGRLNEGTKRVSETLRIFAIVARLRPGSRLHIVGPVPGSQLGSLQSLKALAESLGVADAVEFLPSVSDVRALLKTTSVVLTTSIIEGFQLTLVESILVGVPVVMYDLPYLEPAKDNPGIFTVPWGDRQGAAEQVAALLDDPARRRSAARAGAAALHEKFADEVITQQLRDAFATAHSNESANVQPPTAADELEHARIIVSELFPLFQASVTAGGGADAAHDIEWFYRVWYGSRTIRYSSFLGRPIKAARRGLRTLRSRARDAIARRIGLRRQA